MRNFYRYFLKPLIIAVIAGLIIFLLTKPFQETPIIINNIDKLLIKLEMYNGTFSSRILPEKELVKKEVGKWYMIDLLSNADEVYKKDTLIFKIGEYCIDLFDRTFLNSLIDFKKNIDSLKSSRKVTVYILGQADSYDEDFKKQLDTSCCNEGILKVLPEVAGKMQFDNKYIDYKIPKNITNIDLPNLRAKFIQNKFAEFDCKSTILNGRVNPTNNDKDRNVIVFLFVSNKTP